MARPKVNLRGELPELSSLELDVMDVVWELGECSSADVIRAFKGSRDLADTTIRTVLSKIRKKGYLEPVPTIERGFRVRPKVPKSAVAKRSMKGVISKLFDGSPREAILHLLKDEKLTEQDLEDIRVLIEESGEGADNRASQ